MAFNRDLSQLANFLEVNSDGTFVNIIPSTSQAQLGIGTNNPTAKLDVLGNARVSGNLSATNINASGIVTATSGFVGALTGLASSATQLATGRTVAITGDLAYTSGSFDGTGNVTGTGTLANTAVTPGSYGSSTEVATFTVDSKGRLTAAGTASVGTALTVAGDSGSENISLLSETLTISGGTNLNSSAASNTLTVNLDPNISLTSVVASGIVTAAQFVTGASGSAIGISTNTISGPATITIDPSAVGDNTGLVVIKGDLQIDGTTTTINSTTVTIDDKNIQIADGAANDAAADGAGFTIVSGDGNKTFQFQDTGDNLGSSENLNIASGKVYKINNTEILSSTTLGSGVVNSSLTSVGTLTNLSVGNVNSSGIVTATTFVGALTGDVTGNLTGNVTGNISGNINSSGVSTVTSLIATNINASGIVTATNGFVGNLTGTATSTTNIPNLSGDITSANTVTTLATVNSNVGSFGSQTLIPVVTVNAKGLVTAVTTAAVGTALTVTGDSGSENIDLLSETLTISGGTNLTSSAASNAVTVNLDPNISLTSVVASGIITATSGFVGNLTGNINSSGVSTVTNLNIGGYVSIGNTIGVANQVIASTGVGVTWKTFADLLPQTRTGLTTTATASQTLFSFAYNVNFLDVFVNGVKLSSGEFTASNGTTITLSEGAFANDTVEFVSYNTVGAGTGQVSSLNDLTDVTLSGITTGQLLAYNGSEFVNTSNINISGISTLNNVVVGGATTALVVNGDARITGILTIGTSTLTLDGSNNQVNVGSATTITTSGFRISDSFLHSTGLSLGSGNITSHNINSTGIITASSLSITGNVSIGGTLTYDDVTNVDSIGMVTARTGIQVLAGGINAIGIVTATSAIVGTAVTINSSGLNVTGVITATSFVGNGSGLTGAGSTVADDTTTNQSFFPIFTLSTSGTITASKVSSTKLVFNPSSGALSATDFNSTSDINLKENIRQVESASELVSKLEGVHFSWKETGKETIGVIAQQIEEHLPQLVQTGDTHKTVNYNGLIGVLIEAVKEQGAQIAALQAEIEELKK